MLSIFKSSQDEATAIERNHYTPPPHVHQMDLKRSDITITEDGSIYGHCCIPGCDEGIFLNHNMRRAWEMR